MDEKDAPKIAATADAGENAGDAASAAGAEGKNAERAVDGKFGIHLPDFDGPLDLLLHLIQRDELDIFNIPIAHLTASYLEMLELMEKTLDIEPASEFLLMLATLIHIKSRMLLPQEETEEASDAEPEEDPRERLVRQLLEYQRFKEVALELGSRLRDSWEFFMRPEGLDRPPDEEEGEICRQDVYRLGEAFRSLVAKSKYLAPHDIYVERISIGERIAQMADYLAQNPQTTFQELCEKLKYREEHVTSFLAVLEMSRLKLILTNQSERLGTIHVESRVEAIAEKGEQAAGMLTE